MPYGKKSKLTKKVTGKKKPKAKTKAKPKKKAITKVDRFANYRNVPGATPVSRRSDGSVTMMTKSGSTYSMRRGAKRT